MKFEVTYPTGARHTVQLEGPLVALGRDPSCDLVLNDVKCSRHHAVVEVGSMGLTLRDTGSANGVFVNGKKVERKRLQAGDSIRLGDVILKLVEEEQAGTVVTAPEEIVDLGTDTAVPRPASGPTALDTAATPVQPLRFGTTPRPRPPAATPPPPRAAPSPPSSGPVPRPATATALATLWALALLFFVASGLGAAALGGLSGLAAAAAAASGLLLATLCGVMALGLWRRAAWARPLQIGLAVLGILVCPLSLAAGTTLVYMLRPEARLHFSGRRDLRDFSPDEARLLLAPSAESTFAFAIVATLVVGVAATAAAAWFAFRPAR